MLIDTDAIVLRTVNYSDTSIIAILLSKDYGKITVMAKGARKFKSPFSAQLEPMNILSLNYFHKDGRNIQLLKESSFIENSSCSSLYKRRPMDRRHGLFPHKYVRTV